MNSICKFTLAGLACAWLSGCGDAADSTRTIEIPEEATSDSDGSTADPSGIAATGEIPELPMSLTAVPVKDGVAEITPNNSRVVFIGMHADPKKPDPRIGGFARFAGKIMVADGKVTSMEVSMDTQSIFTFKDALTTHLKNADFFEVNEFPSAEFKSTSIADEMIAGDLTLHGVTKGITFPATIEMTDEGLTLVADFEIDRSEFGMNYGMDKVLAAVQLKIAVGAKTDIDEIIAVLKPKAEGGRGGRGGGRGRGNRDPMKMFADMDKDGNGELAGEEIPERMQGRVASIDTNEDGKISKDEMQEFAKQMQERRNEDK